MDKTCPIGLSSIEPRSESTTYQTNSEDLAAYIQSQTLNVLNHYGVMDC